MIPKHALEPGISSDSGIEMASPVDQYFWYWLNNN